MGERRGGIYARFDARPYTRQAQRKPRLNYIKGVPGMRIHHFHGGDKKGKFEQEYSLIAENQVQLKHSALEAARVSAGKTLTTNLGETGYHMLIRTYPHHILRENSMATGAGADRFSSGMSKSFGRPIGKAARVMRGQKIISVFADKLNDETVKDALRRAKMKFPVKCTTLVEKV